MSQRTDLIFKFSAHLQFKKNKIYYDIFTKAFFQRFLKEHITKYYVQGTLKSRNINVLIVQNVKNITTGRSNKCIHSTDAPY